MTHFINTFQTLGDQILEYMLFPLLAWTFLTLLAVAVLRWSKIASPVFQYHSRIALMLALPLGIGGSLVTNWISAASQATNSATFFIVNNPVSVSPESSSSVMSYGANFWLGILGVVLIVGALLYLSRLVSHFLELSKMDQELQFKSLTDLPELAGNISSSEAFLNQVQLAYSQTAAVPFTYGWSNTKIVIPSDLKSNPQSLAMTVQHELMHIRHRDYLLNTLLNVVRAVFWFHPLVHHLHNSTQDYREITCDSKVLANQKFSKKRYASLLYKLAKREHTQQLAMSMAVNPSSLKKRINIMTSQTNISAKFRSSVFITLISAFLMVITISCTDMADDGITKSELDKSQAEMLNKPANSEPLYIVNGEQWDNSNDNGKKIGRLKSKYIKSMDVLKNDNATEKYGKSAANGAVEIKVNNPEKAFTDLKTKAEIKKAQKDNNKNNDFYMTVEQMPKIEGGIMGIKKKVKYPQEAQDKGVEGKVVVQFIVNEQGNVEDPEVIKGIGAGCDEEALRVIKQAKFEPGMQDGKKVAVQFSVPITFKLPEKG